MPETRIGPSEGTLRVHTYRDGVARKIGHDLVLAVDRWEATIEQEPGGALGGVVFSADPTSLRVHEARNGVKPLTDSDRRDIRESIGAKVLRDGPIAFTSSSINARAGGAVVRGDLTLGDSTRPISFDVVLGDDGRATATVALVQSEWAIKPYRALMGALKVRDTVEVVFDAHLPARA